MASLLTLYEQDLQKPGFKRDAAQEQAVKELQRISAEVMAQQNRQRNQWFRTRQVRPVMGLYLWGGVGRGKTYLMDLFFENLPVAEKLRLHFYRFMERVHAELETVKGEKDPLKLVAKKIASQARVLCFDEFFVEDIADAMILGLLFEALFAEGLCLVTTSNAHPDKLYDGGIQRDRFLPAIELLKRYTHVLNVDSGADYRLNHHSVQQRFYTPLFGEHAFMQNQFELLTHGQSLLSKKFKLNDRDITAIARTETVLWMEFAELCRSPRGQTDYIALANEYKTVLISNVPQLTDQMDDSARRFISVIDEFYDQHIELMLSANVPLEQLYVGDRLSFAFARTLSRLQEML
jgi:cell division protein ZapE